MSKTTEYCIFWDVTMANPNGDLLNGNKPRCDVGTNQLEVSDVRIKRFIRDEWANNGLNVYVMRRYDEANGKLLSGAKLASETMKHNKLSDAKFEQYVKDNYIDIKLFGAVLTNPMASITGPLQIMWSKSVNIPDVVFAQGTAAYASKEDRSTQATFWGKWFTNYALFKTYGIFNSVTAAKQNISVTDEDLKNFVWGFINGLKNYRSTSKNQMPRLIVEVTYKEHMVDGELDYVDAKYTCDDQLLRNIYQVTFDVSRLCEYYNLHAEKIDKIRIYKHSSVKLINVNELFEIVNF